MKNRKFIVVAFVLVAALLVGVGYAVLNDTLAFNGNIATDPSTANADFDANVCFVSGNVVTDDTGRNAIVTFSNTDGEIRDTATIECHSFKAAGQKVVVLLTITNEHAEFDALLTPAIIEGTTDKTLVVTPTGEGVEEHDPVFSAEWEWATAAGEGLGTTDAQTITKNGGFKYILVTITLNETPTDVHTASFNVTLNVTSVEG